MNSKPKGLTQEEMDERFYLRQQVEQRTAEERQMFAETVRREREQMKLGRRLWEMEHPNNVLKGHRKATNAISALLGALYEIKMCGCDSSSHENVVGMIDSIHAYLKTAAHTAIEKM